MLGFQMLEIYTWGFGRVGSNTVHLLNLQNYTSVKAERDRVVSRWYG